MLRMAKILIVDDQDMMRDSLAATLVREGHEVVAAYDGVAGLAKLGERKFDLAITDLKMPKMTGTEFLAEAKKRNPEMPVVLMTASPPCSRRLEAIGSAAARTYYLQPEAFDGAKRCEELAAGPSAHARACAAAPSLSPFSHSGISYNHPLLPLPITSPPLPLTSPILPPLLSSPLPLY
jgi:CheY-like chemotaxis protein